MADTVFTLNTGAKIPTLGFGTWQAAPGEVAKSVEHAPKSGYRHVDAAYAYGNEEEVGLGLKNAFESGIKREDVFVTTKLWSTYHRRVQENLELSLAKLGLDFVDLYLMHWPVALNPNGNHPVMPTTPEGNRDSDLTRNHVETYLEMENLLAIGKVKAIGVANYSVKYLDELLPRATIVPAVNQIENHPLLPQNDVSDYCKTKGILITAYSPLGSLGSPLLKMPVVEKIAAKHSSSPASVLLSYHIVRGHAVLAKSVIPSRIEANRQFTKLDDEDMLALAEISKAGTLKRHVDPNWGVDLGFPDKEEDFMAHF